MPKPVIYLSGPLSTPRREAVHNALSLAFSICTAVRDDEERSAHAVALALGHIRRARAVLRFVSAEDDEQAAMETFFAAQQGIPVVLWGSAVPHARLPDWLRAHSVASFLSLHQAVEFLLAHWVFPGEEP